MPSGENNLSNIIETFVLITLFAFIMIAVVVGFTTNYGKDTTDIQQQLPIAKINSTVQNFKTTSEGWQRSFESQNIFLGLAGLILTSMFGIAVTIGTFITTPFEILQTVAVNVLKIPAQVMFVVYGLVIFSLILAVWRIIKLGR